MSVIGLSSACYYPMETDQSFLKLAKTGIKTAELFMNTISELSDPYIQKLKAIKDEYGIDIVSMHPFNSFGESNNLFSNYKQRYIDFFPLYLRYFECMNRLGARFFVFHGIKKPGTIDDDEYCERFSALISAAKDYSVTVTHENVVHHRCESVDYLLMMKNKIGEDFKITLDIKQAYRASQDAFEFIEKLGDSIVHAHVSDRSPVKDCVPPPTGEFPFPEYFKRMKAVGFDGAFILELYEHSYAQEAQLLTAYNYLNSLAY